MKKLLILLLALVMCLTALTSCEKVLGMFFNPVEPEPEPEVVYDVDGAAKYLNSQYGGTNKVVQAIDYKVLAITPAPYGGQPYTVVWTVDNDKVKVETIEGDTTYVLINVPDKSTEEINYKLTATVSDPNGNKATVTFDRTVPVYNVLSWDAYMAAAKGDSVTVEGIVVAINAKSLGNSRNHLFLADASGKGGYYSYQMDEDPVKAGVKVGMTVSVSGPVEPYSGMQEIKGGTFAIVDETIQTVNPVDITDYILAGNTDFSQYVALTVTIKGVTLGSQDLEKDSSQYLHFELNGLKSYVRTYVTDFPTTLDAKTATAENPDKAAIDKAHADHFGYKADVTGILILYNGNPYLIPMSVDCFENFVEVTYTDEDKIDSEIEGIVLPESITSDTTLELPLVGKNYTDVTIAWAIDNVNYTIGEDGKLPITLGSSAVTVKLTATLTCGTTTKTQEYTVVISANLVMHENHPYGTYINQVNAGKVLFLDGGVDGRYLTTTTDPSKAVAVYAEKAEGGYKLYILVEDVKNYINVYNNDEGKSSVNYSASAGSVFTYDKIVNAWVTTLGTDTVYLGTYKTFETVSVSYTSYINSENTGVSQFPLEILATTPGAALNMFVNQVNADKVLYLDGGVDGRYLTTTTDLSKAVAVYAEKVEGGLKFYILVDGVKNYINVYNNSEGKSSVNYSAEAGSVFTYDPIVNALVTTLGTDTVYLGTYKTFETISVSYTSYIDASNTGVSQFPLDITAATVVAEEKHECENVCQFCGKCKDAECAEDACTKKCPGCTAVVSPEVVTAPAANTAYKFFMVQKNVNKVLYLTGEMAGNYLATTENVDEAIDVYVEVVDGGYKLSLTKDGTKSYLAIVSKVSGDKTYYNAVFTAEGSVFTFNTEYNTFVTVVNETEYVFGTDARPGYTHTTFGANKAQYMSTTFVAHLTLAEAGEAPAHKCESVCPVEGCGKCLDAACTEEACADKCQGHPVTIAKVLEGKVGDSYLTTGTVVAVNAQSFLLSDGTAMMLVYHGYDFATDVAVGDTVTVNGTTSVYGGATQFAKDNLTVTKTGTATVEHGTPVVLTAAELDAYKTATAVEVKYVELVGKLNVSGNYFNLIVDGATQCQGSLTYLEGDLKTSAAALNGRNIKVTGYVTGTANYGKYVNLMVTSVEAVPVEVTIYFKNIDNWAHVSAWVWTASENFTGGNWPGKAATAVEGADGWYSYSFTTTSSLDGLKLIFNNNGKVGDQTADLTYDPEKLYWCNGTAYATMDAANAAQLVKVWYLRGDMTGTSWPALPEYQLQRAEDGTASIVLELAAGGKFKIATADWKNEFNSASKGVVDGVNFADAGGNIKVLTAGTYKFVVSADDSTLTITPVEEAPVQTTVSTTIEAHKTANGWTNETKHTELVLDENVKVTVSGGSNTGKYYDSGFEWRVYQTESPSITVTAVEGKKIVSVKITYNVKNSGVLTQGETQIKSNTVVEVNANSVTFGVGNSGTKTNGQVKITAIEVVYE